MTMILNLAVVLTALAACVFDLRTRRIPNALTFGAALCAFAVALALGGLSGLAWSMSGWLVAVAVFLPFFLLRGMGAGDVKLLGAMGAWLGPGGALVAAFFTAIAGGVMALIVVLARGYFAQTFRNLWAMLMHWRVFGLQPVPDHTLQTSRGPRLAYALPIAAGALVTLWMR
jgi:prepilin peptidase CpaA